LRLPGLRRRRKETELARAESGRAAKSDLRHSQEERRETLTTVGKRAANRNSVAGQCERNNVLGLSIAHQALETHGFEERLRLGLLRGRQHVLDLGKCLCLLRLHLPSNRFQFQMTYSQRHCIQILFCCFLRQLKLHLRHSAQLLSLELLKRGVRSRDRVHLIVRKLQVGLQSGRKSRWSKDGTGLQLAHERHDEKHAESDLFHRAYYKGGAGWHPARRLVIAAERPINNRLQVTNLPHIK